MLVVPSSSARKRLRLTALSLAIAWVLASVSPAMCQMGVMSITGRVRTYNNVPLPSDTSVSLETDVGEVVSQTPPNSAGEFNFTNLPRANYRVVVTARGFETAEHDVQLQSVGDFADIDVFLNPRPVKKKRNQPTGPQVLSVAQLAPRAARKDYEKGMHELDAGRLSNAGKQFAKAVKRFPCYANAQVGLSYVNQQKKDYSAAKAALKKAIACDPGEPVPYFRLGMVLNEERDFEGSRQELAEVMGRFPNVWELHYAMAIALSQLGNLPDSEHEYLKVLSLNPAAPSGVHAELSEVYLQEFRYGKAYEQMQNYLTQDPKGPVAGIMRQQMHDLESSGKLQESTSKPAGHDLH